MVSSSSIPSAQRLEPALPGFFQLSSLHELREDVCHFLWPAAPWWITSEQLSKARLPLGQEHGCVSCGPHNRRSGHVCLCCSQHLPTCESAAGMDQIWYWSVKDNGALSPWPGLLFFGPTKNLRCKHSKQKEYWQVFLPSLVFVSKLGCAKWLG